MSVIIKEKILELESVLELEDGSESVLKWDRSTVLEIIKGRGRLLEYVSSELKSDREIVLAAVRNDGYALRYADESLRGDREIVLAAVGRVLDDA